MIGQLRGKLLHKSPPHLVMDVQGVGYEVECPMSTFYQLPDTGSDIHLYTHLTVREDAHLLFGFATEAERQLFRTLIKVNGIGPKLALTILSGIEAPDFVRCIRDGDSDRLTRLPGIGKKTAERLVIEMRDRLKDMVLTGDTSANTARPVNQEEQAVEEAISALIGLGYKPQEASRYVHAVARPGMNSETIIREALKNSVSK